MPWKVLTALLNSLGTASKSLSMSISNANIKGPGHCNRIFWKEIRFNLTVCRTQANWPSLLDQSCKWNTEKTADPSLLLPMQVAESDSSHLPLTDV